MGGTPDVPNILFFFRLFKSRFNIIASGRTCEKLPAIGDEVSQTLVRSSLLSQVPVVRQPGNEVTLAVDAVAVLLGARLGAPAAPGRRRRRAGPRVAPAEVEQGRREADGQVGRRHLVHARVERHLVEEREEDEERLSVLVRHEQDGGVDCHFSAVLWQVWRRKKKKKKKKRMKSLNYDKTEAF